MWTALFSHLREVHKRSAIKEDRLMKTAEASHKQAAAAAGSKMTVHHSPMGLRSIVSSLVVFFIVVSSVSLLFDRGQEAQVQLAVEQHQHQEVEVKHAATDAGDQCNWSLGRWVYDNASRPLYSGLKCAFIFDEVACDKYGRNDTMYQHWRWQPHGCNLPRYGSFEGGDARLDEVEMVDGFEIALKKLTEYLDANINKNKTRIFFTGSSPAHSWASDWGGDGSNKCLNETEPIQREGYKGATTDYSMMDKAKQIFGTLEQKGIHVKILNITQLSDYRKDAHPTVFRRQFVPLTKQQIANPSSYADCTHWCLPGVPDVWNEFLYAYLVHK